jgi:PadR family transcriptional regulator, regulatory protein PadR
MGPQPRMTVQTLGLLSAMLDAPYDTWYGLELGRVSKLKSGTLYPILARLERAGWLSSSWEEIDPATEGRPRRRLYRLTGAGADSARLAVDGHLAELNASSNREPRWGLRPGEQPS